MRRLGRRLALTTRYAKIPIILCPSDSKTCRKRIQSHGYSIASTHTGAPCTERFLPKHRQDHFTRRRMGELLVADPRGCQGIRPEETSVGGQSDPQRDGGEQAGAHYALTRRSSVPRRVLESDTPTRVRYLTGLPPRSGISARVPSGNSATSRNSPPSPRT